MSDAPKYWSEKRQKVVRGIKRRQTLTQFADVLGLYVWIYSGDHECPGDVVDLFRRAFKNDKAFIAEHSMTLGVTNHKPTDIEVTPKDVHGLLNWGSCSLKFDSLQRVPSRDKSVEFIEGLWEIRIVDSEDGGEKEQWLDDEGNTVSFTSVLDDNGHPFLIFDWSHPEGCHGSWSGYYIGKKLVEGKKWRLTSGEERRLGIGLTSRRLALVSKKGGPEEGVEEDDDEDDEEGDETGETDEGEDDEDDDGEAQVSEAENLEAKSTGAKRKATEGDDKSEGPRKSSRRD